MQELMLLDGSQSDGAQRKAGRAAVEDDNPCVKLEKAAGEMIGGTLEGDRQFRDTVYEPMFTAIWGAGATFGCTRR